MSRRRLHDLLALAVLLAACDRTAPRRASDDIVPPADTLADASETTIVDALTTDSDEVALADVPDTLDATDPDTRDATDPDMTDTGADTRDVTDATDPDATDTTDATGPDTTDTGADTTCLDGAPCQLQGFVPPCYEGRCAAERCLMQRIPNCCTSDLDCAGPPRPACAVDRCVARECRVLDLPGCCTSDDDCDDGLASTIDRCLEDVGRCERCPLPCPGRPPLWVARFDGAGDTPAASGLSILDLQPGDPVTWQRTTARAAAGQGSLYLGNPRCETYYGGALDAACLPVQTGEQDSQRVAVTVITPPLSLPASSPAVLTAWVRAEVEPDRGRGQAEPDVLRVAVEPLGLGTTWELASTLTLGKSTDWAPLVVDLSPFSGQTLQIRFAFDTFDGVDNRFAGVWLDELVVAEACAQGGCCASDDDCAPASSGSDTACVRSACLQTSDGGPRLCALAPRTPGETCLACVNDPECDDGDPCTADRCEANSLPGSTGSPVSGSRCTHTTFCCLARDLLVASFAGPNFIGVSAIDDTPGDGVRWQSRAGAAWFGEPLSDTYASLPPPRRVSGALETALIELPRTPSDGDHVSLEIDLRLSTEWDLATSAGLPIDNPAGLDRVTVELVDGPFTTLLWSSDLIGGTTSGQPLALSFDLDRWVGRAVRLRLRFDSGDELANDFGGLFVDRFALALRCQSR